LIRYKGVVDEIILVAVDPEQCKRFHEIPEIQCISDLSTGIGPIGGLHAGSRAAKGEFILVSACDMPCINPSVIEYLFGRMEDYNAVIPCWNPDMLEPQHAVTGGTRSFLLLNAMIRCRSVQW